MSRSHPLPLLEHIFDSASCAVSYVDGVSLEDFLLDRRTKEAVAMNLINIGEAATKLLRHHAELLDRHPHVRWRSMLAMRNRIAHGYTDLDFHVVWETVTTSLPDLLKALPPIIREASAASAPQTPSSSGDR